MDDASNPFLDVDGSDDAGFGPEGAFAGLSAMVDTREGTSERSGPTDGVDGGRARGVFGGAASANAPKSLRNESERGASAAAAPQRRRGWIFSLSYYQQFFDVDTEDVVKRASSVFTSPHRGDFLDQVVNGNPDLYAPIWGCATLVFLTALGSAWAKYNSHGKRGWDFDAKTVSLSAALIYGYVFVFSLFVYLMLSCYARVENLRVSDVWCLYGYSVLAFIPVCVLATVPLELFRWIFFAICAAVSTLFLTSNVRKRTMAGERGGNAFAMSFVTFIGASHFVFAVVLKLFFFQYYIGH
ncbi:putative integral membrane Yip1 family protein [Ostreococcus tauri]|uniref:Protein YIP n=1 Tax=Ostreococcus tauri TaxID=70448 RepID=A0A1Y5IDE6_OSTTA|nr:putative integral membrane Yip1 family protein [Ostreococcus tauri]